ncbi:hypothetical protein Tco_0886340 [Tanacetum coccineum]
MLVQPTEDEGEASERPSESQPIPYPSHPSEDQPKSQPDPSPRPSPSIPIPNSGIKTASTPVKTQKPLFKDEEATDVDVHLYRSMIGSLMYLTASRPDIMFAVCACSRYQKQTIMATSTTEAGYVAAANCCGQVLWIQNLMLDYGFNFMNTKIYIDNESTICIVKNPVFHSKTKHIEIRHHFIRDAYEKKLIQVLKIHIDDNVADLLTKAFDVSRFNFLIVNLGMINQ